eukprot:11322880-Prorocentrum_lima.AAC.1
MALYSGGIGPVFHPAAYHKSSHVKMELHTSIPKHVSRAMPYCRGVVIGQRLPRPGSKAGPTVRAA